MQVLRTRLETMYGSEVDSGEDVHSITVQRCFLASSPGWRVSLGSFVEAELGALRMV